jgi:hypothetical protein
MSRQTYCHFWVSNLLSPGQTYGGASGGLRTGRVSHSTRRIAQQFGTKDSEEKISYQSKKSVNRVQHALQDQDRESNTAWVSAPSTHADITPALTPSRGIRQMLFCLHSESKSSTTQIQCLENANAWPTTQCISHCQAGQRGTQKHPEAAHRRVLMQPKRPATLALPMSRT